MYICIYIYIYTYIYIYIYGKDKNPVETSNVSVDNGGTIGTHAELSSDVMTYELS